MTEIDRDQEAALRSYLLGLSPAEEQKRVEERLLSDSDYFNELQRVEECLTDEYVRGEIQGGQKKQFDSHFLTSEEHREGLEFARLLHRYFSEQDVVRNISLPPAPKWRAVMEVVLASASIVLMAASTLLFRQVSNLRGASARLQQERTAAAERERALAAQLADQQQALKKLTEELANLQQLAILADFDIVSLSLDPGLDRTGANVRRAVIHTHTQALRLELKLPAIHYQNYRSRVETAEGDVVWTANGLISHPAGHNGHRTVTLVLPVAPITRSQYLVRLTGTTRSGATETVATYYLNLIRK
jgi:hypothetical protein